MKPYRMLIAAGLLTACQGELPMESEAPPPIALSAAERENALIALEDALNRIIPGMSTASVGLLAARLTSLLGALAQSTLNASDVSAAIAEVDHVKATDVDSAELDAIRLAVALLADD